MKGEGRYVWKSQCALDLKALTGAGTSSYDLCTNRYLHLLLLSGLWLVIQRQANLFIQHFQRGTFSFLVTAVP